MPSRVQDAGHASLTSLVDMLFSAVNWRSFLVQGAALKALFGYKWPQRLNVPSKLPTLTLLKFSCCIPVKRVAHRLPISVVRSRWCRKHRVEDSDYISVLGLKAKAI